MHPFSIFIVAIIACFAVSAFALSVINHRNIEKIEKSLEENKNVSTKISEKFTDLSKRTESFENLIQTLSIQLPPTNLMMQKANSLVQSYDTQMKIITDATAEMNKLKSELSNYASSQEMVGIKTSVTSLGERVTGIEVLGAQQTALQSALAKLETTSADLKTANTNVNTKLSEIETELKKQAITPEQQTAIKNVENISKLLGINQAQQAEILADSTKSLYARLDSFDATVGAQLNGFNTSLVEYGKQISSLFNIFANSLFDVQEGSVIMYNTKAVASGFGSSATPDANGTRDITIVATGVVCGVEIIQDQKFATIRWDRIVAINPVGTMTADEYLASTSIWKTPTTTGLLLDNPDIYRKSGSVPQVQIYNRPDLLSVYYNADKTPNTNEAQIRAEVWRTLSYFGTCGIGPTTFRDLPGVLPSNVLNPIGLAFPIGKDERGRNVYPIGKFQRFISLKI